MDAQMLFAATRWLRTALAFLFLALALRAAGEPRNLRPGQPLVASLAPGQEHRWRLEATGEGPWRLGVAQRGVDVELELVGPGEERRAVDGPFDRLGWESLVVEGPTAGMEVVVRAGEAGAPAGVYELRLETLAPAALDAERAYSRAGERYDQGQRREALAEYLRARCAFADRGDAAAEARSLYAAAVVARLAGENAQARDLAGQAVEQWRQQGDAAFEASAENELGLAIWLLGDPAAARERFERARDLAAGAGFPYGEAVARANLCLLYLSRGELEAGLTCYEEALPRLAEVQAVALEGAAWTNVGRARDTLGRPEEASAAYDRALERLKRAGNREGEARVANNLGILAQQMGDLDGALARYGEALAAFRELGDRRWQAWTLGNLGLLYAGLDELEAARAAGREALGLWQALGEPAGQASTLMTLGLLASREGKDEEALALHGQAVELRRGLGDRRGLGLSLTQLARAQLVAGRPLAGRVAIEEALELLAAAGDQAGRAEALLVAARVDEALGDPLVARARVVAAQALAREGADRPLGVRSGVALAELERRLGRGREALAEVVAALDGIEGLRPSAGRGDLAASYGAVQQRAYELAIDLQMAAHRAEPGAGWEREALATAERARARALLDVLTAAKVDLGADADPQLFARKRSLERQLAALGARAVADREAVLAEEARLSRELDLTEARLRETAPAYGELTRPRPLGAAEIQARLEPSTLLLVYRLGEQESHLWALTEQELEAVSLPPAGEIEDAVRRFHELAARFDPADRAEQAALAEKLSRLLLAPVSGRLGARRVAIVADGALAYLPFSALPVPGAEPGPAGLMVAGRELLSLPSASVLEAVQRLVADRSPAPRRALLLADPADVALPRLPGAGREAEAIAALAPAGEVTVLTGAAARREVLLGPEARSYRVLHFATHGLLDSARPALSGLLLAGSGGGGAPGPGFLGLADLYSLDLDADLVVLSACRTALGREIRGEGLSGLARGFLHAGVPRVVASLWPVEDRATARLMTELYRGLWQRGLAPAAALAEAQRAVRAERRWQDPYFWAGFTLQGGW
ncbi:MAG TPA: CHAT domain-containing tetratricopeptide repeat protein [Thermoanaerobaculia bacterium]|nr:CHAT domain-containing tetratricopeptide repeat protein [Thermoanaerobaculia bacterium]